MIEHIVMDSRAEEEATNHSKIEDDDVHQDQKYKALAILIMFVHDDIIIHITNVKKPN